MSACRCGLGGIWAAICSFLRALPLDVCFFAVFLLIDGVSRLCLCVLLYLDPLRCDTMPASNYAEFLRRSALDWEASAQSCPRGRVGCAFCARCFWRESMQLVYLSGPKCFMAAPAVVWQQLSVTRYSERWPLIPIEDSC